MCALECIWLVVWPDGQIQNNNNQIVGNHILINDHFDLLYLVVSAPQNTYNAIQIPEKSVDET